MLLSILVLLATIIWQWDLLKYGIAQGRGQLDVIINARPIDEFLSDPNFPDSLKQKLLLSKEVRAFAMEELGLNQSKTYTKLYDQKGKILLWNLSASDPFKLEPYTWYFPFLGEVPYKGFFKLKKAQAEEQILDSLGYDTRVRPVSGWSTLGILNDPLLSNMLERSDGELAEVIIHELTHATIFVKEQIDFNENLASFIGERGAELFLSKHFGDSSEALISYQNELEDHERFTVHMLRGANGLDSLYQSFTREPDSIKAHLKALYIREIVNNLDTIDFHEPFYKEVFKDRKLNNAYFMSLIRYHGQSDTLTTLYAQHNKDLHLFIQGMKETHGK